MKFHMGAQREKFYMGFKASHLCFSHRRSQATAKHVLVVGEKLGQLESQEHADIITPINKSTYICT